jgi:hypothetical protein
VIDRRSSARPQSARRAPYNFAGMGNTLGRLSVLFLALAAFSALVLGASAASGQTSAPAVPAAAPGDDDGAGGNGGDGAGAPGTNTPSQLALRLGGLKGGKLKVGNKFKVSGTLRPWAAGEKVTLILYRGKKTLKRKTVFVKQKKGANYGKFSFDEKLVKPGRYSVQAIKNPSANLGGSKDRTRNFKIDYPDLDPGNKSSVVALFNRLLEAQGYVNDEGKSYDSATGRAVLAFHKVNGKSRTENADPGDFKKLADGRGGYKLKYPKAGKHVEADLSRQVMVLAKGGKVDEIYHISSGAPATPTILGHYQFYRKEPGVNNVGMVNSVYFIRGYATHGYPSVPDYPASHGCLRNPIPDSMHIYNWIDIGDDIYVYN